MSSKSSDEEFITVIMQMTDRQKEELLRVSVKLLLEQVGIPSDHQSTA